MVEALNEEVLKNLQLLPSARARLLDAGCGTGATLRYLSAHLPGAELHGIGLAPGLIEMGRQLNGQNGVAKRIQLRCGDFQRLPFPRNFFDAIVAIESVCYATGKDKAELAREFSRVLTGGGTLVVVDVFMKSGKMPPRPFRWILRKVTESWAIEQVGVLPQFIKQLELHGLEVHAVRILSMNSIPSALHIPLVVARLLASALLRSEENRKGKLQYAKALFSTLLTGILTPYLAYTLLVAEKSSGQGDK